MPLLLKVIVVLELFNFNINIHIQDLIFIIDSIYFFFKIQCPEIIDLNPLLSRVNFTSHIYF